MLSARKGASNRQLCVLIEIISPLLARRSIGTTRFYTHPKRWRNLRDWKMASCSHSQASLFRLLRLLRNRQCKSGSGDRIVANVIVRSIHDVFDGYGLERYPPRQAPRHTGPLAADKLSIDGARRR